MKKWIIFFSILAITGCKSKKKATSKSAVTEARVTKVPADKVDADQRKKAYDLGKRVLMTCNTSRFKPFNRTEATEDVIRNTTEDRLTKTCHNFRLKYGEFRDLKFVEAQRDRKNKLLIYRFRAEYSKKIANKELRVTMNEDNLVSSIKSMDWKDIYK